MPIDRSRFGSRGSVLPKLTADMIPTEKVVLTVREVREVPGRGDNGDFLSITFVEFADFEWTTNATQEDALIALVDAGLLPGEFHRWEGHRIPFYKKTNQNPQSKEFVKKLYPVEPEDFDRALAAYDENARAGSGPARARRRPAAKAAGETAATRARPVAKAVGEAAAPRPRPVGE